MSGGSRPLLSAAAAARRAGDEHMAAHLLWASIVEEPVSVSGYVNLLGLSAFGGETVPWRLLFGAVRVVACADPVAWKNLAIASLGKGWLKQARASYRRALALEPGRASLLVPFSKGLTSKPCALRWAYVAEPNEENRLRLVGHELVHGDPYLARRILEDGGRPSPSAPTDVILHWAKALSQTGDTKQAIGLLEKASTIAPLAAWRHYELALLYRGEEWSDRVKRSAKQALLVAPDFHRAYALIGRYQVEKGTHEKALKYFTMAIQASLNPDSSYVENLAASHVELRNLAVATSLLRPLVVQDPSNLNVLSNFSTALHHTGELRDAGRYIDWCLMLNPNFADAYCNRGITARMRGDVTTAKCALDRAVELSGGRRFDVYTRGIFLLSEGDPIQGARDYDARWEVDGFSTPRTLHPKASLPLHLWTGECRPDAVLALWGEQGVGDEIWFSSFIHEMSDRVGGIRFEVTPHLAPLIQRSFPDIRVLARGAEGTEAAMRSADIQCPVGNLLTILAAENARPGYLSVDQGRSDQLKQRYRGAVSGKRLVGISWRSIKPGHRLRSFEAGLDKWGAIFRLPDTVFVSLQYGDVTEDRRLVKELFGIDLLVDSEIDGTADLDVFAAQVAAMDAVVSVANSAVAVAHGLGKPTYVALQLLQEDWRYSRSRATSRWLPMVRQAWQAKRDHWAPVLEALAIQLAEEIPVPQNEPSMDGRFSR